MLLAESYGEKDSETDREGEPKRESQRESQRGRRIASLVRGVESRLDFYFRVCVVAREKVKGGGRRQARRRKGGR